MTRSVCPAFCEPPAACIPSGVYWAGEFQRRRSAHPGHGFEARGKKETADCIILHLSRHGNRHGPWRKLALVSIATQGKEKERREEKRKREGGGKEAEQNGRNVERDRETGKTRRWKKNRFGVRSMSRCRSECTALTFNRVILITQPPKYNLWKLNAQQNLLIVNKASASFRGVQG